MKHTNNLHIQENGFSIKRQFLNENRMYRFILTTGRKTEIKYLFKMVFLVLDFPFNAKGEKELVTKMYLLEIIYNIGHSGECWRINKYASLRELVGTSKHATRKSYCYKPANNSKHYWKIKIISFHNTKVTFKKKKSIFKQ